MNDSNEETSLGKKHDREHAGRTGTGDRNVTSGGDASTSPAANGRNEAEDLTLQSKEAKGRPKRDLQNREGGKRAAETPRQQ